MQQGYALHISDMPKGSIIAGDIIVDPVNKKVMQKDRPVRLTPRQFRLLEYLILNKNKVLSREEIACGIWDRSVHRKTERVPAFMNNLRKKLHQDNCRKYIYTIVRKGYLFSEKPL